ncbi:MAG: hypothetical protein H6737_01155 [Alphaproteobacteria bacterium]|nr:hypothetical protein [Alphaproteobacteria bacterium]
MTRCIGLCIPLLWAVPAFGAEPPVIAVVGVHQPGVHLETQSKVSKSLATAVERTKRAAALEGDALGPTIAGRQQIILEEALLASGRKLLAEGQNLYNQAQPEAALPVLEEAIDALEAGVVLSGELRDLWDAQLALGTAHMALGDTGAASSSFRRAVALNPARSPDPALYPPDVTALFDDVRAASRTQTSAIAVASAEPLDVWVDGASVGKTPTTVKDVLPGVHYVRAHAPERTASARVEVGDEPVNVVLEATEPTLGAGAGSSALRGRETTALYRALGRHSEGVDFVLLAGTEEALLHLQLYDVARDTFSIPTSIPYTGEAEDEALQTLPLLLNLLTPEGELPANATQASAVPLDRGVNPQLASLLMEPIQPFVAKPRRGGRTAVLVGIGVGVLAASGAGIGIAASSGGPRYHGTVVVGPL